MSKPQDLGPELSPYDEILFVESHRPPVEAGDYTVEVTQQVKIADGTDRSFTTRQPFSVAGERFSLAPDAIHALFPPPGSHGHYGHVSPHVILERSTLPWERSACYELDHDRRPPWLALLLFTNEEAPAPRTTTLGDLKVGDKLKVGDVELVEESAQHDGDALVLIDVPSKTLAALAPSSFDDFGYRTHVRQVVPSAIPADSDPAGGGGDRPEVHGEAQERAVVLGNRLPASGERSVVHLVSLESFYEKSGALKTPTGDTVSLVSLKSWEFFCLDETKTFKGLLVGLNGQPTATTELFLPPAAFSPDASAAAGPYLRAGLVPLRHGMRAGDRSVSWYHGPLVPREPKGTTAAIPQSGGIAGTTEDRTTEDPRVVRLPARAADSLTLYDETLGMFDVSYAAAWELGRLLTLKNTRLALRLFHWKRRHAHALRSARHLADFGFHLPGKAPPGAEVAPDGLPPELQEYFDGLLALEKVPFAYLVPDERLLPPESLRFFSLDRAWVECLRDGAWSVGRVLPADVDRDAGHVARQPPIPALSGLLLRSEVVSGYPGLQVDAYSTAITDPQDPVRDDSHLDAVRYPKLRALRKQKLSKNVLLCLYVGEVRMVDVHLKPETLHFGLDLPDEADPAPDKLLKKLRTADGEEVSAQVSKITVADGVVDFPDLASKIATELGDKLPEPHLPPGAPAHQGLNPAIFALEMVAGGELVRFIRPERSDSP